LDQGGTTRRYQIIFGEGNGSREESKENGPRLPQAENTQDHIFTVPRLTARDTLRSVKCKVAEALILKKGINPEELDEILSDRYQFQDEKSQSLKLTDRIGKIES